METNKKEGDNVNLQNTNEKSNILSYCISRRIKWFKYVWRTIETL